MVLDRASDLGSVQIWDTVGDLAADMATETAMATVVDIDATVVTDTDLWVGASEAGAWVH